MVKELGCLMSNMTKVDWNKPIVLSLVFIMDKWTLAKIDLFKPPYPSQ